MSRSHSSQFLFKVVPWIIGVICISLTISVFWAHRYLAPPTQPKSVLVPAPTKTLLGSIPITATVTAASASTQSAALAVPVLMYHYVEHIKNPLDILRKRLNTSPEILDSDLQTLQQAGYNFLFMSDVADALSGKTTLPSKPIVLTFDDGYRDFYTDAFPILKKHHVKATAYIISGFIGKPNYMFLPQLLEIQQSGLVEIGAHTVHHVDLSRATPQEAEMEIDQSKLQLEKIIHAPVRSFAYPSGRYNSQTIALVKAAGFTTAVTTEPGIEINPAERFVIRRFRPGGRNGIALINFLRKVPHSS